MKTIDIHGRTGHSSIHVGARLEDIPRTLPLDRTVIVTDPVVRKALSPRLPPCPVVEIGTGETATWTFADLEPGRYQVLVTWIAHSNRASNSPFSIFDGGEFLAA